MHRLAAGLCIVVCLPYAASATAFSYVGALIDPNDVFTASFALGSSDSLLIQTYGYGGTANAPGGTANAPGGTANAPGGTDAAGAVIAPGGFDPYVSVFVGTEPGATFLVSNDDGICGPGFGAADLGHCFDSTLQLPAAAAGIYTLALTLPANFSFAENQGNGTLDDGFIGLAVSFDDVAGNPRSGRYAVDIVATAIPATDLPEPSSFALLTVALAALPLGIRARHSSSTGSSRCA